MREVQPIPLKGSYATFVRAFLKDGNATAAAIVAGFSELDADDTGRRLLQRAEVIAAVQYEVRRGLVVDAPNSIRVLRWLRDNADTQKIRLDAAKSLAAMAGHVAPRAAAEKPADQPLHEMTTDQLRELAGRLEDEIAGRAKVISADAAPAPVHALDVIG